MSICLQNQTLMGFFVLLLLSVAFLPAKIKKACHRKLIYGDTLLKTLPQVDSNH